MKLSLQVAWKLPDAEVYLGREIDIPFIPHPGMRLVLDGYGYNVKYVAWDDGNRELFCRLNNIESSETWEKAKEDLLRRPYWTVSGVYSRNAAE